MSKAKRFTSRASDPSTRGGSSLMQILIGVAVLVVVVAIVLTVMKSSRVKKELAQATTKMRALGEAFKGYADDNNGLLPAEDAPGRDDWIVASSAEAEFAWYNVLPKRMGAAAVGELVKTPAEFYRESYPLFIPGAPYPDSDKKLSRPYFAVAMNSRLQRANDDGTKPRGTYAAIQIPERTVILLERGMPGDKKVSKLQGGFDAGAKANAGDFAARHNEKGILVFADGHAEVVDFFDLVDKAGRALMPQEKYIWTSDPSELPY